jgi:hypothetical protein
MQHPTIKRSCRNPVFREDRRWLYALLGKGLPGCRPSMASLALLHPLLRFLHRPACTHVGRLLGACRDRRRIGHHCRIRQRHGYPRRSNEVVAIRNFHLFDMYARRCMGRPWKLYDVPFPHRDRKRLQRLSKGFRIAQKHYSPAQLAERMKRVFAARSQETVFRTFGILRNIGQTKTATPLFSARLLVSFHV